MKTLKIGVLFIGLTLVIGGCQNQQVDTFKHTPSRALTPYDIEKDETSELAAPASRRAESKEEVVSTLQGGNFRKITLNRDFMEKYKNVATISLQCKVLGDAVHSAPEDGDVPLPVTAAALGLN